MWTPNYVVSKELENIYRSTTRALKSLLPENKLDISETIRLDGAELLGSVNEKRATMAKEHTILVEALVAALGHDKALQLGREALFEVGKNLGKETRQKLGVGNEPRDLIKAAKILYRVLGIDFSVQWLDETKGTLVVDHCELARKYSELTCLFLSATDEGVVRGLEPNATMTFKERITGGCPKCIAEIQFAGKKE